MITSTASRQPNHDLAGVRSQRGRPILPRRCALVLALLLCLVVQLWGGLGSSAAALPCPLPDHPVHTHAHRHSIAAPLHQHGHLHLRPAAPILIAAPHADHSVDHHPLQPSAVIPDHAPGERVVLHHPLILALETATQPLRDAPEIAPCSWQGVPPTPPPRLCA